MSITSQLQLATTTSSLRRFTMDLFTAFAVISVVGIPQNRAMIYLTQYPLSQVYHALISDTAK